MIDTPLIVRSTALRTACIPLTVPRTQIRAVMGPGIGEVLGVLATQGIAPSGPWFTHHRRKPTDIFDFAICVPIPTPVTPTGRVQNGELPAATVARTVYHGGYEGLGAAWGEFHTWIAAQGHARRADLWEFYVKGPESSSDATTWQTELNQPLIDRSA